MREEYGEDFMNPDKLGWENGFADGWEKGFARSYAKGVEEGRRQVREEFEAGVGGQLRVRNEARRRLYGCVPR